MLFAGRVPGSIYPAITLFVSFSSSKGIVLDSVNESKVELHLENVGSRATFNCNN